MTLYSYKTTSLMSCIIKCLHSDIIIVYHMMDDYWIEQLIELLQIKYFF